VLLLIVEDRRDVDASAGASGSESSASGPLLVGEVGEVGSLPL
jgi:hypothetical protein